MGVNKKVFFYISLFLLILISHHFFELRVLRDTAGFEYLRFLVLTVVFLISIPHFFKYSGGFTFPVKLISVSIMFSVFMANYSWGQSIMDGLKTTMQYMPWVFMFFLLYLNPKIKDLENFFLVMGVIYIVLYFYQFVFYETKIFGWDNAVTKARGTIRVVLPGGGSFFLLTFLALTNFTQKKNPRWLWTLLTVLGLVIPIMQATRQFIASVLFIYVFHFIKAKKPGAKIVAFVIFISALIVYNYSDYK
ncbi:MAG: hypothetical protein M0P66_16900, partial [Salinivirgaceae bacterium]|nr:hypothetical protein [Salinivirgaceae bacterium]